MNNYVLITLFEEKFRLLAWFVLNLFISISELLGLASVGFLLAMFSEGEAFSNIPGGLALVNSIGVLENAEIKLLFFLLILLCLIALSRFLMDFIAAEIALKTEQRLSQKLFYNFSVLNLNELDLFNPAILIKNMINECSFVGNAFLVAVSQLISRSAVIFLLVGGLLLVDFEQTIVVALILTGVGFVTYRFLRGISDRVGECRRAALGDRFEKLNAFFDSFREVKVSEKASFFGDQYEEATSRYCGAQARSVAIGLTPRVLFELLLYVVVGLIVFGYLKEGLSLAAIALNLGVVSFVVIRILPLAVQLQNALVTMSLAMPSVREINRLLGSTSSGNANRLSFEKSLELRDACLHGSEGSEALLKGVNLKLNRGDKIWITGRSGVGKTRLLDLMLGLRPVHSGQVVIDGKVASDSFVLSGAAYVPQDVVLFKGSFRDNLLLGVSWVADDEDLRQACEVVGLGDLVRERGIEFDVGVRGCNLSGGQKQRAGLARAILSRPSVLILDEVTSGLDKETERQVLDKLVSVLAESTVIFVSHRPLPEGLYTDKWKMSTSGLECTHGR